MYLECLSRYYEHIHTPLQTPRSSDQNPYKDNMMFISIIFVYRRLRFRLRRLRQSRSNQIQRMRVRPLPCGSSIAEHIRPLSPDWSQSILEFVLLGCVSDGARVRRKKTTPMPPWLRRLFVVVATNLSSLWMKILTSHPDKSPPP